MIGHLHSQQQKWLVACAIICMLNSECSAVPSFRFLETVTSNEEAEQTDRNKSLARIQKEIWKLIALLVLVII